MARIAVLNLPEHGHMNATFALVGELARRGHDLTYWATEPFRSRIEAAGAAFRSYGAHEKFRPPAHAGGLYSVMAYLAGLSEKVLPDLLDELREHRPDVLLIDSMCAWGHLANQVLGLPAVTLASVFVTHDRMPVEAMVEAAYGRAPKEVVLSGIDALSRYFEIAQRLDQRHGTRSPNIVEFFSHRQALNLVFTSAYFHLESDRFDATYKFVGPSVEPRDEAIDFPFDRLDGRPLIYVSMGTIFNDRPDFFSACYEAFRVLPFQVVVALGDAIDPETLGPVPDNFIVRPFIPQLEILRRTSLFLTHGGMNSVNEALWNDVPLLVYPQHGDQHLTAGRVAELGAGLPVMPPQATAEGLRGMAAHILGEPGFKAGAAKIGASLRSAGGAVRAADEITTFIQDVDVR